MKTRLLFALPLLILSLLPGCAGSFLQKSRTVEVSTTQQFRAAVLRALPGTVIEAADGDYRFDDSPLMIKGKGTAEAPIIIRAKHLGKARFTGEYAFFMEGCSYVTLEGFSFFNRALKHSVPGVLDSDTDLGANRDEAPLWGSLVVHDSDHCRLTRLHIQLEEREGFTPQQIDRLLPRLHWVNFTGGGYNRIDHCRMKDKKNSGVTVVTGIGEHHIRIDHNHFNGRPPGKYNGFETIRPGTGDMTRLYGIIEYNLFENCDGEGEIISVKSSVVLIRRNTFLNCMGMLSIRHANYVTVDHNFFINSAHKPGVGGVRIHGNDNNVLNNYFGDLTGNSLSTFWGDYDVPAFSYESPGFFDFDYGAREYSYRLSCRANIAYNTWAHCADFLNLGEYQKRDVADMNLPPVDWSILNNLVVSNAPQFIKGGGETGFRWVGNIFWNPNGTFKVGRDLPDLSVKVIDPKLVREPDGLWRLSKDSPAVNSAEKTQWYWIHWVDNTDMDGQSRDIVDSEKRPFEFDTDVGADEYSSAPKKFRPLTSADVGPDAP